MATTRIAMPAAAKAGEIIEIRTLIQHIMETGHRRDDMGRPIARDIIKSFVVTYNGTEIFRTEMFPELRPILSSPSPQPLSKRVSWCSCGPTRRGKQQRNAAKSR